MDGQLTRDLNKESLTNILKSKMPGNPAQEKKKAACGINAVVADYYRAVVQRSLVVKKIAEKKAIRGTAE